jgi:hypothetical protein
MLTRAFVLMILTLAVAPTRAGEHLAITVSPTVAFEPADLVVRATVEANAENRMIEVIAESDGYYRSSQIQLEGERAPRTTLVSFRSLPEGSYSVRVVLRGSRGQALATTEKLTKVVGRGAND